LAPPGGVCDVLVCGAGAAGSAAALAASRAGASVVLVEAAPRPGGTVANCLIHTLGGLYDSSGRLLNGGLVAELTDALARGSPAVRPRRLGRALVLNVCPDHYRAVLERWLAAEPRLLFLRPARLAQARVRGGAITEAQIVSPGRESWLRPRAVIDATGTAEVARLLGPSFLQGQSPAAAGGLILRLGGVAPGALAFPRGVALVRALRSAAAEGALPPGCGHAWLDSGVVEGEAYLKLFVPLPDDWRSRREELTAAGLRDGEAALTFLKRFPAFAEARVTRRGELGVREGGRARGEYCLSREDVLGARKFADAACRCSWPIELWHPESGVSLEYPPEGDWFEVPLRALKVQGIDNLWAVGKCLSADAHAQASARIAGACWAMGEAAGRFVAGGTRACH
jgi:FAD dependent oxidoreductase